MRYMTQQVRAELIQYLCDGNTKEELADQLLSKMNGLQLKSFVSEVKEAHSVNGDYPHTAKEM